MKIVHEIRGKVHVSIGAQPYATSVGEEDKWNGWRGDLLIVSSVGEGYAGEGTDVLYMEGDSKAIEDTLKMALVQIQGTNEFYRKGREEAFDEYVKNHKSDVGGLHMAEDRAVFPKD